MERMIVTFKELRVMYYLSFSMYGYVCLVFVYIEVYLWFRLVQPNTESICFHRLCIPSMFENQSNVEINFQDIA